jgi:hypothetical protein
LRTAESRWRFNSVGNILSKPKRFSNEDPKSSFEEVTQEIISIASRRGRLVMTASSGGGMGGGPQKSPFNRGEERVEAFSRQTATGLVGRLIVRGEMGFSSPPSTRLERLMNSSSSSMEDGINRLIDDGGSVGAHKQAPHGVRVQSVSFAGAHQDLRQDE